MVAAGVIAAYARDSTRRWFTCELPDALQVRAWSELRLDRELHTLSHWEGFSTGEFRAFAWHQLRGLELPRAQPFRYLEVGVGVGAFSRELLRLYPLARGDGFDIEERAVTIAGMVLPRTRFQCGVGDMRDPTNAFYYRAGARRPYAGIIVPGALCYLHSQEDAVQVLTQLARMLRRGGRLCASMLPSVDSDMGSCNTRVPKALWARVPLLHAAVFEAMDGWNLTAHAMGRYAACATRRG